jgi:sugar phosphate isomerase/epimerase
MTKEDLPRLSINAATLDWRKDLKDVLAALDGADIRAIAPWLNQVQARGVEASARMLADHGMTVTGLCRAGFFTGGDGKASVEAVDEVRRAIDEAATIGAQSLTIVVGGLLAGSRDLSAAHGVILDGLAAVLPHARGCGVPLAIEPLHPMYAAERGCVNSVAHANDICDQLGDGLGIAVDIYHVWWDTTLERELARAGPQRLMGFHLCDWLVPTRDMLLDRGMMGDGIADIPRIMGWMEGVGYSGYHEVEIFSAENWWKRDAGEVLRVCKERYLTAC